MCISMELMLGRNELPFSKAPIYSKQLASLSWGLKQLNLSPCPSLPKKTLITLKPHLADTVADLIYKL